MYVHTHNDLGQVLPQPQSTSPKLAAADPRVLRKAASLARSIDRALREIEQSIKFLATPAQQDLLKEIVGILRTFFPSGFGVKQKNGVAIKGSTRYRTDVPSKSPSRVGHFICLMTPGCSLALKKASRQAGSGPLRRDPEILSISTPSISAPILPLSGGFSSTRRSIC